MYPSTKRYRFWWFLLRSLLFDLRQICNLFSQAFEQFSGVRSIFVIVRHSPDHDIGYALLFQVVAFDLPRIFVIV